MHGRVELSVSTWQQPWPPPVNPRRSPLIADVVRRIETLGARRVRVAVDGRTAAGKTTLAHEVAWPLSQAGRVVLRASLDDFKRPWADAHRDDRVSGEGYLRNAFDLDAIRQLLLEPAHPAGGHGFVSLCSIDPLTQIDHSSVRVLMPDDGILVVGGVFALRRELDDHWDLRIWVDIDPALSLRRAIDRDAGREGTARAEALRRDRYGPAEAIYIAETDPVARADVVIDNSSFDNPRLVRRPP